MKITLIISSLVGGGAEKVCVNIANGLAKKGWSVDLVVLNLKNSSYLFNVSKNVNLVELKVNHARYAIFSLLKYIYKNKPNLFLVFNYELTVLIIVLRNLFSFKFKIITRNINTLSKKIDQLNKNFFTKYVVKYFISKFYCKADYIICQCLGMRDDLIEFYPKLSSNLGVIYNPINEELTNYVRLNNIKTINKRDYLLCVGRLEKQKAFQYAIEAFAKISKKFPNLRLKILGIGSQEKKLKDIAKNFGVINRIDFEGFQKNIIPYYLYAKATLLTSLYEGFPNSLIESIKLGTPVISFDCPNGPAEIIKDGINGYLVKYKNVVDLENKILTTMNSKFNIDNMNLTIKKHYLNEVIQQYDKLLKSYNYNNYA
jgi:glycosyltransferase involved in cell wall biosynthesis